MRRPLAAALAVLAIAVAGCGGSSTRGVSEALSFVPKGAPLVVAIQTDTSGAQYKQVGKLLARFPGGSAIGQTLISRLNGTGAVNYQRDIKPVLGNDLIVAAPTVQALRGRSQLLVALKAGDEGKAKSLIARGGTKVGTSHGSDVFASQGGQVSAIKDGVIVEAPSRGDLDAALSRADGSDHMTSDELDARLTGLPADALVRVGGDLQALLSQSASGGTARRVAWVNALQTFGVTAAAQSDGLAFDFDFKTSPTGLRDADLPLASGAAAPSVIARAGEVALGVRGLDQTINFIQSAAQAVNPAGLARFTSSLRTIGSRYHVDVQRDVFGQLSGNTALSIGLDGGFALRTQLPNPAAFRATLAKLAPALPAFGTGAGLRNAALAKPGHGNPFYALAGSNGKRYVFGVVGSAFVLATDPGRAGVFATDSPTPVPGATGALSIESDARALGAAILRRSRQGAAAQFFIAPLGALVGSLESRTSGLSGHLKLTIH